MDRLWRVDGKLKARTEGVRETGERKMRLLKYIRSVENGRNGRGREFRDPH